MSLEIDQKIFDTVFRKQRKITLVFLRSSKSKVDNYDPFRETGFEQTNQNTIHTKALTKVVSPGSLTYHELGLVKAGALQIIVQNRDVELIKNSEKLIIDSVEYYAYDDAVGQKFLMFPTQFAKFTKIIIFRKEVNLSA